MNTTQILQENICACRARVMDAAAKWGGCEICAVTKTVDVDTINAAKAAGITTIGENRVQELMSKIDRLDPDYRIHLIGQLQTNKVKYIVGKVHMVQSLDRDALAEELSKRAEQAGIVIPTLVQVNIAREPQKSGIDEDELLPFIRRCGARKGIRIEGLMAIMPFVDDPEDVRDYFRRMRVWFDRLRDMSLENTQMNTLSMGMSADCLVAAQEGATMVRMGRALFGARPAKQTREDA